MNTYIKLLKKLKIIDLINNQLCILGYKLCRI
nr:MAG TPA: hypothetical protein [Caudoviricetes sp.]